MIFKNFLKKIPTGVWVALSYLALSLFITYPLVQNFSTAILGWPEDNRQFIWNLWWFRESVLAGNNPFVTTWLFFPTGSYLYLHTLTPLNGLIGMGLQLFMNLTAAYNSLILFSLVVSGLGMYYLALDVLRGGGDASGANEAKPDRLTILAAWLAGLIFTFAPRHVAHIFHHLNIIGIQFIPFFILALRRLWQGRAPYANAVWAALAVVATFYTDFYNALYIAVFAIIFLAHRLLWDRAEGMRKKIAATGLMIVLTLVACAPLLVPVIGEKMSGAYPEKGWDLYGADLVSFVVPPSYHWLAGDAVWSWYKRLGSNEWEATHYLGLTVLVLAAIGVVRYRRELYFWLGTGAIFLLLSFGPALHVWGHTVGNYWPYYWLIQRVPVLNLARSAGRFSIFVVLVLALAAAFGARVLFEKWQWRYSARGPVIGLSVLAILVLFEFTPGKIEFTNTQISPLYEKIAADPAPGAIADIPMGDWDGGENYMLLQTMHHRPTSGGTISRGRTDLYAAAMKFEYTREYLAAHGFRYLILHKKFLTASQLQSWQERVQVGGLQRVGEDDAVDVYQTN